MSPTSEVRSTVLLGTIMSSLAGSAIIAWTVNSPETADSFIERYCYTIIILYAYARVITHASLMKQMNKYSPTFRSTGESKGQDLVFFVGDFIFAFFWLPIVCFVFYGAFWKENELLWVDHTSMLRCFFCAYLIDRVIHLTMGGCMKMQRFYHHSLVALTVLLGIEILPPQARDVAFMMVGQQEMFVRFAWPGYIVQQFTRQAVRNMYTPSEGKRETTPPKCLQDLEIEGIDGLFIPRTPQGAANVGRFAFLVHVIPHYVMSPGLTLFYLTKFHSNMHWFWIVALPCVVTAFSVIAIPQVHYFFALSTLEYWTERVFDVNPPKNAYFGGDKLIIKNGTSKAEALFAVTTKAAPRETMNDTSSNIPRRLSSGDQTSRSLSSMASITVTSITEDDTSAVSTVLPFEIDYDEHEPIESEVVMTRRSLKLSIIAKQDKKQKDNKRWPLFWLTPNAPELDIAFGDIVAAEETIKGSVKRTACEKSQPISDIVGASIFFKKEFQQYTGSFKERGARNAIVKALKERGSELPGVVAASTGNHALALSYHGKMLGVPVTVVMPTKAPLTKVNKCKTFGATIILKGEHISEAEQYAHTLAKSKGFKYVNGYDDPAVLAGAGTIGIEIMEDVPEADIVVVPVGGAGQIAGISCAVKAINPNAKVIGVEPYFCPSYTAALNAGKPVPVKLEPMIADGLGVPQVGKLAFEVARHYVNDCVLVTEKEIMKSILCLLENEKFVVEGGGAIALASLLPGGPLDRPDMKGKNIVVMLSGANIDTPVLQRVLDRGLAADSRLVEFEVTVADRASGISALTELLLRERAHIKDMSCHRAMVHTSVYQVQVKCTIELEGSAHGKRVREALEEGGYDIPSFGM